MRVAIKLLSRLAIKMWSWCLAGSYVLLVRALGTTDVKLLKPWRAVHDGWVALWPSKHWSSSIGSSCWAIYSIWSVWKRLCPSKSYSRCLKTRERQGLGFNYSSSIHLSYPLVLLSFLQVKVGFSHHVVDLAADAITNEKSLVFVLDQTEPKQPKKKAKKSDTEKKATCLHLPYCTVLHVIFNWWL